MKKSLKECPLCGQIHDGQNRQCAECDDAIDSDNNDYKEYYESNMTLPSDHYNGDLIQEP